MRNPLSGLKQSIKLDKITVLAQLETGIEKSYQGSEKDLVLKVLREETEDLPPKVSVKEFSKAVARVYKRLKIEQKKLIPGPGRDADPQESPGVKVD